MKKDRSNKTLKIDTEVWRQLKIMATNKDCAMIDLAEGYIQAGLEKENLKEDIKR